MKLDFFFFSLHLYGLEIAQLSCATHVREDVPACACFALRPSAHANFTTAVMVFVLHKLFLLLVFICC